MTDEKLTLTMAEACALLGRSTAQGYKEARAGTFVVKTLRLGKCVLVPRIPFYDALGARSALGVNGATETKVEDADLD